MLTAATVLAELVVALETRPDLLLRLQQLLSPQQPSHTAPPPEPIYATVTQAMARYQVSRRTIFAWVRAGMPTVGRGRTRRVDVRRADSWLREHRGESTPEELARARARRTLRTRRDGEDGAR